MENFVRTDVLKDSIERLYKVNSVSREDTSPLVYSVDHDMPEDLLCSLLAHVIPAFLTNLENEDSEIVIYIHCGDDHPTKIYISKSEVPLHDGPDKL